MNYVICRDGNRIAVKRSDRDYDFKTVITVRDTFEEAMLCARVERMVVKHIAAKLKEAK